MHDKPQLKRKWKTPELIELTGFSLTLSEYYPGTFEGAGPPIHTVLSYTDQRRYYTNTAPSS